MGEKGNIQDNYEYNSLIISCATKQVKIQNEQLF